MAARGLAAVTLVACADVMTRNLLATTLQEEGHSVLSAADGQEALELSRLYRGRIDLLLTDVDMNRLPCADLCSLLLDERPGVKVLVMLGTDMDGVMRPSVNMSAPPRMSDVQLLKAKIRTILAASLQSAPFVYLAFLGRPLLEGSRRPPRSRRPLRTGMSERGGGSPTPAYAAADAAAER